MSQSLEKKPSLLASLQESQNLHWAIRKDQAGYTVLANRLRGMIGTDMPASEKNRTLMACRLAPILRRRGCRSYQEYEQFLRGGEREALQEFVSTLTTHTTDFYRESQHFSLIPQVFQKVKEAKRVTGRPELRVWCAAASTGQEPFTMLISLLEAGLSPTGGMLKFLASDVDRGALVTASRGRYTVPQMAKVPQSLRDRYFDYEVRPPEPTYVVKPYFRRLITFAEFNLFKYPYPFQFPFDIVFCRNVLIYFDLSTGQRVVDRIAQAMALGGFLFVGHSETGFVKNRKLKAVAAAVYQRT
jgi:chemotaxis protein methyltransferase CheR